LKIRYALMATGIVSALVAAPAFSQADNTNSRWSPSTFDTSMQHDQVYGSTNPSTYYYYGSDGVRYYYEPSYTFRDESGWRLVDPRDRTLVIGRMDPDLVYGPTPNEVRPGTSLSNPSGTELSGQNSGGK